MPNPKRSFFKYEFEKFKLDFLPELKASLNFRTSFSKREVVTFNEIEIPFINYEDLIMDKKATARSKDIADVEQLNNRKGKRSE